MSFFSGVATAAGTTAAAGIYTAGRVSTNIATVVRSAITAAAQIRATKWMIDRQEEMWDHVAHKQINCVEVALNEFIRGVDVLLPTFKDAYPEVPVAARYVAVDPQVEQYNAMVSNIINVPKSAEYMIAANHWHRLNFQARAELLSPGFTIHFATYMGQIGTLLAGQLPVDEAVGVTTSVAENAAMLGKVGNTRMLTSKALGIRRLQIQSLGRDELSRRVDLMQKLSPVEVETTLDDMMIKPERRLQIALEQAQILQNDLQNVNNAIAQKRPHLMAELQTKLQLATARLQFNANKANMQNQFVPNISAVFGPAVNSLMKSVTDSFSYEKDSDVNAALGGHLTPSQAV